MKFIMGNDPKRYKSFQDWKEQNPEKYKGLEKFYFSYEDWIKGDLPWSAWNYYFGESICYNSSNDRNEIDVLPQGEYDKIVEKQVEVLEYYILRDLNWMIKEFEANLEKSLEKREFIKFERQRIEDILTNKAEGNILVFYNEGQNHTYLKTEFRKFKVAGQYNEMAIWYNRLIICGEAELRSFISPEHIKETDHYIPQVLTKVYYDYMKYLEKLLNEDKQTLKTKNRKTSQDLTFEYLFRQNQDREKAFFKLLGNPSIGALGPKNNWIYNKRKSSIVACFEALEDLNYIRKNLKKSELRKIVETKIQFEGSEKLFRLGFNQDDYDYFLKVFKSHLR